MDLDALIRSRVRVKVRTPLRSRARYARHAAENFLKPSYIRSFAWIGSVELCTGVLCETCQGSLRDFLILKVREGSHHATASSMLAAVGIGCRMCTCLWRRFAADRSTDSENVPKEFYEGRLSSDFRQFSRHRPRSRLPNDLMFRVWDAGFYIWHEWSLERSAIQNAMAPQVDLSSYQHDRIGLMNHYWKLASGWLSVLGSSYRVHTCP